MAQVIEDRIRETTTTTGTGDLVLSGAVTGFRTFGSVCATNDTVYCCVVAVDQNGLPTGDWEVGNYTYVSANTLSRTKVLSSSNNNLHVNFGAGTKHVFLDLAAYQITQFAKAGETAPTTGTSVWPYGWANPENEFNNMVFNDEFNGTILDSNKWHDRIWYRRSATSVQNYKVSGGNLMIWPVEDPNATSSIKHSGTNFIEREIVSDGKFSHQWGYFEARIRMPYGKGMFPAWWLFNHQLTTGTLHTEIDIMECYTSGTSWGYSSNQRPMDYVGTVWNNQVGNLSENMAGNVRMYGGTGSTHPQVDLSADFHVYAARWDRTGVQFYFDGEIIGSGKYTNGKILVNQDNFNVRPMYLLFDLWYGGDSGSPDSTTPQGEGNSMLIDYVRVWPLKNP